MKVMQPLGALRLEPIVDHENTHAQLLKICTLASPLAAMQATLMTNGPKAYNEDAHMKGRYIQDVTDLLIHVNKLQEACSKFKKVHEAVENSRLWVTGHMKRVPKVKSCIIRSRICYYY